MESLGVASSTAPNASPAELIQAAGAAGLQFVSLRAAKTDPTDLTTIGSDSSSLRRLAESEGLSVLRAAGFWLDPQYSANRFYPHLASTADLGARYITILGFDPDKERMTANFVDLCDRAAEFGLLPTVEPCPFSLLRTPSDALALLERSGKDDATLIPDVLHVNRSGATSEELAMVPASRIAIAHLCDAHGTVPDGQDLLQEARSNRLDLGEGQLPVADFLAALPKNGVHLEIEIPCFAQRDLSPRDRVKRATQVAKAFLEKNARGTARA